MQVDDEGEVSYSDDDELVAQFVEWTSEAVTELRQIIDGFVTPTARGADNMLRLYDLTHNIKGMGSSFNFDLMTAVGTSLCAYMKGQIDTDHVSFRVLEAHVRTFEVILQHRITGSGGAQGEALKARLQTIVQEES